MESANGLTFLGLCVILRASGNAIYSDREADHVEQFPPTRSHGERGGFRRRYRNGGPRRIPYPQVLGGFSTRALKVKPGVLITQCRLLSEMIVNRS